MGIMPVSPENRKAVAANLFAAALPTVEPWDQFRWHGLDTAQVNSSQALAIDVFGTLQQSPARDQILNALATRLDLPAGGEWTVQLEWVDNVNRWVHETTLTEVDVMLSSPHVVIFCECKFGELGGASCSQRKPLAKGAHRGIVQCNGKYEWQTNPANSRPGYCALTAKGIRYWEVIPQIFDFAAGGQLDPCPFAGSSFQWMRNLTGVCETARRSERRPAFLLVYADGPGLHVANWVKSAGWPEFAGHLRPEAVAVGALSYQAILQLARETAPEDSMWVELTAWVEHKIARVCRSRGEKQAARKIPAK